MKIVWPIDGILTGKSECSFWLGRLHCCNGREVDNKTQWETRKLVTPDFVCGR